MNGRNCRIIVLHIILCRFVTSISHHSVYSHNSKKENQEFIQQNLEREKSVGPPILSPTTVVIVIILNIYIVYSSSFNPSPRFEFRSLPIVLLFFFFLHKYNHKVVFGLADVARSYNSLILIYYIHNIISQSSSPSFHYNIMRVR